MFFSLFHPPTPNFFRAPTPTPIPEITADTDTSPVAYRTSGSRGGAKKIFLEGHFFIAENAFSGQKKRSKIFKIFPKFSNKFCIFRSVSVVEAPAVGEGKPANLRAKPVRGIPKGGGRAPLRVQNFFNYEPTTAF